MCLQIKQGYTLCPHVFCDLYIMKCETSYNGECCDFQRTGIPDWIWGDTRMIGKCHFCMLEELDERDRRRRMRKLDFDREVGREDDHSKDGDGDRNDNCDDDAASEEKK